MPGSKEVLIPEASSVYYGDDGTASEVLGDHYDPDYEPSKEEVKAFAKWLGMHPVDDEQLMWIAREGLRAPLPEDWRSCKTKGSDGQDDDHYYFNFRTGESIWDHPLDAKFKELYKDQSQKKKDGKPFKRCVDNEVLEGLGIAKIIKAHEAKKKKGKKLTQTDTLERQNSGGALTSTEAENKKGKSTDGTAGSTATAADASRELDELKRDRERIAEEERLNHEKMQKHLKHQHEQELQDLEMELDRQLSAARRKNSQSQQEWERELDEQNAANRRRFERELMQEFEAWKREKEAAIEEKRNSIEAMHKEILGELEQKGKRLLDKPTHEHELAIAQVDDLVADHRTALERLSSTTQATLVQIAAVVPTACSADAAAKNTTLLSVNTEEGEEVEDGAVSEDANSSVPSDFVFVPKAVQGAVEEEGVDTGEEIGVDAVDVEIDDDETAFLLES